MSHQRQVEDPDSRRGRQSHDVSPTLSRADRNPEAGGIVVKLSTTEAKSCPQSMQSYARHARFRRAISEPEALRADCSGRIDWSALNSEMSKSSGINIFATTLEAGTADLQKMNK